jgi:hypothetical protein
VPPKPGRVTDTKPPYVPEQTKVTQKPAYATLAVKQSYVRPTRQNFMRPVYRPAPTYNNHPIK